MEDRTKEIDWAIGWPVQRNSLVGYIYDTHSPDLITYFFRRVVVHDNFVHIERETHDNTNDEREKKENRNI